MFAPKKYRALFVLGLSRKIKIDASAISYRLDRLLIDDQASLHELRGETRKCC
jgi:hypothetical protein